MESQYQGRSIPAVLLRTILAAKDSMLNADAQEAISHPFGLQSPELYAECVHSLTPRCDKWWKPHSDFIENYVTVLSQKKSRKRPSVAQRIPDFHDIRHMKVVSSSAPRNGRLYPQECSWYSSFSLGAEATPWPWCGRKEYVTEKSSDTIGNRSRGRQTSSATP